METSTDYPEDLLPKTNYVRKIENKDLKNVNPYLQRKCDKPLEECCVDNNLNRVTAAAFGEVGLHDMSVNLMGALFKPGDERWHQKVRQEDDWNGKEVNIEDYEGKYELQGEKTSVYFLFNDVHEKTLEYPATFGDRTLFDKFKSAIVTGMSDKEPSFSKSTSYKLTTNLECHHNPSCLNYWHMIVKTLINTLPPTEVKGSSSKYQKQVLRVVVEHIRSKSTLAEPSAFPTVKSDIYIA